MITNLSKSASRLACHIRSSNAKTRATTHLSDINIFQHLSSATRIELVSRTMSTLIAPSSRVREEKESVWNEFIQLALEEKPLNLGQGLPDYVEATPDHIKQNLVKATVGPNFMLNQYTRGYGHPRLVNAISSLYSKLIGRSIDSKSEVLVTIGAYESIYCIINAFIDKGDEAIIIEPFFDCYEPMVRLAGGKCRFIPLRLKKQDPSSLVTSSADWVLDPEELKSIANDRTKLLILNTPHNPIGKVFSKSELEAIADICKQHNILVLSDEVYEHLVIDGEHHRIASLPGMWDRTITVGSAGKTFSVTGWKLGWCYGPKELLRYVSLFHQNCIYVCPTPLQEAVAESFEIEIARMGTEESYWANLAKSLKNKRDAMVDIVKKAGVVPTVPEGGYFMMADTSKISSNIDFSQEFGQTKDHKFVRWLSKYKKLQGIPPSAFYSNEHKNLAEDFIRLCYFKNDSTMVAAEKLFENVNLLAKYLENKEQAEINMILKPISTHCDGKPAPYSDEIEAIKKRDSCSYNFDNRIKLEDAKNSAQKRPIRVYADGIYDMFHAGHEKQLKQAKEAFPNVHLIVGVVKDELTRRYKGPTVVPELWRYNRIRNCPYVDEVKRDAPWVITEEFLKENKIDFVAHDDRPYECDGEHDIYKIVKDLGMFLTTQRTDGISTSDLKDQLRQG